jgi:hypothetical protein
MQTEETQVHDDTASDFDGVTRFTNWLPEPITLFWNSVGYTFEPLKRVPLQIPDATPKEVEAIRKKFAMDLAVHYFYNTDKFKSMDLSVEDSQAGKVPALYTEADLAPYIQKCLEPLPLGKPPVAREVAKPVDPEKSLRKDNKGKPVSKVVDQDEDTLVGNGTVVA